MSFLYPLSSKSTMRLNQFRLLFSLLFVAKTTHATNCVHVQRGPDIVGEGGGISGFSLAMNSNGSALAIGAPDNNGGGPNAGHVRVFQYDENEYVQHGQDIECERSAEQFGSSVAMNGIGNIVAVGAPGNPNFRDTRGRVAVFEYSGDNYIQRGGTIDGEGSTDAFGYSVAMSNNGDVLAIGAIYNHGAGIYESGHVRVLEYDGMNYVQRGRDVDGKTALERSGSSVAMNHDGSVLAIASRRYVRVFQYNGTEYVQRGQEFNGVDIRGLAVSKDGDVLTIGDPGYGDARAMAGRVRVLQFNGTRFVQRGQDIYGEQEYDFFGWSVAMNNNGSIIAVGAHGNDDGGEGAGHVRVFYFNGTSFVQRGEDIDGNATQNAFGDNLGWSVSMNDDGNVLAVGAIQRSASRVGYARVFECISTENPSSSPTSNPSANPTERPSSAPTVSPTIAPTVTLLPTSSPTSAPSTSPSSTPTKSPTIAPTTHPTTSPTTNPSNAPTKSPISAVSTPNAGIGFGAVAAIWAVSAASLILGTAYIAKGILSKTKKVEAMTAKHYISPQA